LEAHERPSDIARSEQRFRLPNVVGRRAIQILSDPVIQDPIQFLVQVQNAKLELFPRITSGTVWSRHVLTEGDNRKPG